MAKVRISDIIQPAVWLPYVRQQAIKFNRFLRSGIMVPSQDLQTKLAAGGAPFINVPHFNALSGSSQVLTDAAALSVGGITTGKQIAYCLARGDARSINDLAPIRSGADPAAAIADGWAQWWNEDEQGILIAVLTGVFADNIANDAGDLVHDISIADGANAAAGNKMSGTAIINAAQKLGDAKAKLTAIVMHSQIEANLAALDQITAIRNSEGALLYNSYKGLEVITDDDVPVVAGGTSGHVYTSYLMAKGSVARAENIPTEDGVEFDRDILAGDTVLTMRKTLVVHPIGFAAKYAANQLAGDTAANTELDDAAAWDRVWEKKNCGIVAIKTNG
jgi:hypothetical protein